MILKNFKMRISLVACAALISLVSIAGFAQNRTQNLGDFSELKVFNGLSVEIERSVSPKIEISGEKTDEVVVKNVNGRLKLSLKFPETFNADKVKVKIFFSQDLSLIDANEGSAIFSEKVITQQKLAIRAQEGAYIHVPINIKYIIVKAVSGGAIKLRGETDNQDVEVTTGGIYEAYDLMSHTAEITSASGSTAEVTVSNTLDAKVRFGGKIFYKGEPKKVNTKKVIGGQIKNKG